jgi:hypothetical protein
MRGSRNQSSGLQALTAVLVGSVIHITKRWVELAGS